MMAAAHMVQHLAENPGQRGIAALRLIPEIAQAVLERQTVLRLHGQFFPGPDAYGRVKGQTGENILDIHLTPSFGQRTC